MGNERGRAVFWGIGIVAALGLLWAAVQLRGTAADSTAFIAPRIGADYLAALAKLPDWNGRYEMTGGSPEQRLMFDVDNLYYPEDPGGVGMGPMVGAQDIAIPLNDEYARIYSKTLREQEAGKNSDPVGNCRRPHGMPRQMGGSPEGPTIFMTPDYVEMGWTWLGAKRRIYTDGRPHPKNLVPSYMGHSIGRWEGDVLVADTVGMLAGTFDQSGAPHSDQVRLTERIRLIDNDTLQNDMVIEDPVAFTGPWHVTRRYRRSTAPDPGLVVNYCMSGDDNLRYVDGYQHAVLPSELDAQSEAGAGSEPSDHENDEGAER